MKRIKKFGIGMAAAFLLSVVACPRKVQAQSIAQVVEQLILDKEKLAELKTILQDMYKSYEIIDQGYSDIRNIVRGNFDLHKAFLDGLLAVSPVVGNYSRVKDIVNAEGNIVKEYKAAYDRAISGGHFTGAELRYISNIYSVLFTRSLNCIDELTMVVTPGSLRMSDGERLRAIDGIYTDINGQLGMLRTFDMELSVQDIQRAKESGDIGTIKSIYGIIK